MNIVITGGAGFLGQRLAKELLSLKNERNEILVKKLHLVDIQASLNSDIEDVRLKYHSLDLSSSNAVASIINKETTHVYHLAAIVSSHAEQDFDLGMEVNLMITWKLLERCRQVNPKINFIFSSSLAVFGKNCPEILDNSTAAQPQSSYGTQKAMAELLVNDYGRKGFVNALTLRLPTICIRPGKPNMAASSFVSAIIREPLNGEPSNCPVKPDLKLWISSPDIVVKNFIHALSLKDNDSMTFRCINLPWMTTTPKEMIDILQKNKGEKIAKLLSYNRDKNIEVIVSSWPHTFDTSDAKALGFIQDDDFDSIFTDYLQHYTN